MMRMRYIHVCAVVFATLVAIPIAAVAQSTFAPVRFTTLRNPSPGYYLLAPNSMDSVGFVDHGGHTIHAFPARRSSTLLYQRDSTVTFIDERRAHFKVSPALQFVDTIQFADYATDFHECRTLANGNTVILGFEPRIVDMSMVVQGGRPQANVMGAIIREVTPKGDTVLQWSTFDHLTITDATTAIDLRAPAIDYAHPNSISEDTDGHLLVSIRHFDAVIKIHRSTGEILWWLGGQMSKRNDFTWLNDTNDGFTGFSHQHTVEVMSNGNILMFDNGNLRKSQYSRAVIYKLDQARKTVTRVWEYRHPRNLFANSTGSVQELPNGNILIGWGSTRTDVVATEVTTDGVVEAELVTDRPAAINTYRVMKAVFSMTGVQDTVRTPGVMSFVRSDSTAHLRLNVTRCSSAVPVVVERHWNTLQNPSL